MNRRTRFRTIIQNNCLSTADVRTSVMTRRWDAPIFYPPPISPQRHAAALAFLRSVAKYFRFTNSERPLLWRYYLPVGDRLLQNSWRFTRPRGPASLPSQYTRPVLSKAAAKSQLAMIHELFDRRGVPRETRRLYFKEMFIIVICSVHRVDAELERLGYYGDAGSLH